LDIDVQCSLFLFVDHREKGFWIVCMPWLTIIWLAVFRRLVGCMIQELTNWTLDDCLQMQLWLSLTNGPIIDQESTQ